MLREPSPDRPTAAAAAASSRNTLNSSTAESNEVLKPAKSSKTSQIKDSIDTKTSHIANKVKQTVAKTTSQMSYYVLPLNNDGQPRPLGKGSLISLPVPNPSYHLRLVVSSVSEISRNGKILTNVPKKGDDFDREKYQAFE